MPEFLSQDGRSLLESLSFVALRDDRFDAEKTFSLQKEMLVQKGSQGKISIGMSSCGLGAGAAETMESLLACVKKERLDFQIIGTGCIGLCSEEPIMIVSLPKSVPLIFGRVTPEKVEGILKGLLQKNTPDPKLCLGKLFPAEKGVRDWPKVPLLNDHPFFHGQTRRVLFCCGLIDPYSIEEYLSCGGYRTFARAIHTMTPDELLHKVESAGLLGLGGGIFPVAEKWKTSIRRVVDQKFLICNADEGDPGAYGGRCLMEGNPHLLLEGISLAAYAIGATKAFICIRTEYKQTIRTLNAAVEQSKSCGLTGENILDSGVNLSIIIRQGAGAFVCGEETALISCLEGKSGTPYPRPPYPAESGYCGLPTVVSNVETLANLPRIIAYGPEEFRKDGASGEYGTKIVTLSGKFARAGIAEVPFGIPLKKIIDGIAGGSASKVPLKMIQIGGPAGGFLPAKLFSMKLLRSEAASADVEIGAGGIIAYDESDCIVEAVRFSMDFLRRESCGRCIPCHDGTDMLWHILDTLTHSRSSEREGDALKRIQGILSMKRIAGVLRDTSLCGLGRSAAFPILTSLRWFHEEYEAHLFDRRCPAAVCSELQNCGRSRKNIFRK